MTKILPSTVFGLGLFASPTAFAAERTVAPGGKTNVKALTAATTNAGYPSTLGG